jgi:protein-L-isoaspartate(D-aspartate) O-methyltransferase
MADQMLDRDGLVNVRRAFARQMLVVAGVDDDRLEAAFSAVPREAFLGTDPWHIIWFLGGAPWVRRLPTNDPVYVYQDLLATLAADRGVNNGSPSLHARMLHHLAAHPGIRVVHIGAGMGYYTAILAEVAGATGHVVAVEFGERLADAARSKLAPWKNVTVICGNGAEWPVEAVDRVYVNFAVEEPAAPWIERLAREARLVFPLGVPGPSARRVAPRHTARGAAPVVQRGEVGLSARWLGPASFVCAEDFPSPGRTERRALSQAFKRGGVEFVKSLRWRQPTEPARCWFWSPRWSLSFDAVDESKDG